MLCYRVTMNVMLQDDYECTTRLISSTIPWPSSCNPIHTVFELVDSEKQWHNQHDVEGPIVVVDRCVFTVFLFYLGQYLFNLLTGFLAVLAGFPLCRQARKIGTNISTPVK